MGKVSRYLILAVVVGVSIVGFWVYQKYFKASGVPQMSVTVERGDLEELVRVQGEVVPTAEYNLEFATPGIVGRVYVQEGQQVAAGAPLVRLDTSELVLEKERLDSLVADRAANLAKLIEGATGADIAVYEARVASAATALKEAEKAELLAVRAVFTAMDDAVKGTTDMFYSNANSLTPQLSFNVSDSSIKSVLEAERVAIGAMLKGAALIANATSSDDLQATALRIQSDAQQIGTFLDRNVSALNVAVSGSVSLSTIQSWQSAVATARNTLNAKAAALGAAEEARSGASAALTVIMKELALKKSPPRAEDVSAAKASANEVASQVKIVEDKIRKATLNAPEKGRVVHIAYKVGETARVGEAAVILNGILPEVRSDVSELDIANVHVGAPAYITFDALPGNVYPGTIVFIDPLKVEKEGDTYYRVRFSLSSSTVAMRPGMTAEVMVRVSKKTAVIKLPEYATYERDGISYARVEKDGVTTEVPVTLGISDGQFREVISGLSDGDKVIVPTD